MTLLTQPPKDWDYTCVLPGLASICLLSKELVLSIENFQNCCSMATVLLSPFVVYCQPVAFIA